MHRLTTLGLLFFGFLVPAAAKDKIVSYVNERGVRVYTNMPSRSDGTQETSEIVVNGETAPEISRNARGAELFRPLIEESARRHAVDPELVEAIMAVESAFDPFAVSQKDCKGLMQLHPDTARRFGVEDVFDPAQNIEGGVKYIKYLQEFFENDLTKVVAAYNAGENAVERHGGTPPYQETRNYVRKIGSRFDLSAAVENSNSDPTRGQRVHRIKLPDGRILYTNTPVQAVSQ